MKTTTLSPIITPANKNNYVSFVNYGTKFENNNYVAYNYTSFNEVNQYIQDQINIFSKSFIKKTATIDLYGKTMSQRYQDIFLMQTTFLDIMKNKLKSYYGDDYDNIVQLINKYSRDNDIINNGLDELNGNSNSIKFSQNILVDSTVFSTVLWTILAICLLYYVFIKL
jgi:hypothetical protein